MAKVYHALEPTWDNETKKFPDEYALVATVSNEDVDTVYRLTNSIDSPWWKNFGVTPEFIGEGCRSTSVGDIVELANGTRLICCDIGWEVVHEA